MKTITLNNGVEMPMQQMGTWQVLPNFAQMNPDAEQYAYLQDVSYKSVTNAIEVGYRAFDTANLYNNEEGIGNALADSKLPREDFFITTKFVPGVPGTPMEVTDDDVAYKMTVDAIENSLSKLKTSYIDLFLIHGPAVTRFAVWKAMEEYYKAGKIRALGISNFDVDQIKDFDEKVEVKPTVLQTQVHPYMQDMELINCARSYSMVIQALTPLMHGGAVMTDETITSIAESLGVSQPQVILRWHFQKGYVPLPKSNRIENIRKNFDIFSFELDDAAVAKIDALAEGKTAGFVPTPNA